MKGQGVLTASGSPLVAGTSASIMKTVTVKVTRAFLMKGVRQEVGTILEVDNVLAGELRSAGKAIAAEKLAPKPEPKPEAEAEPTPAKEEPAPKEEPTPAPNNV